MRIIPSENDGFVLVLLDFAFFDQLLLLRTDALQKYTGRFIGRVLGDELSLYGHLLNGFLELIGKHIGKFFKLLFCLSVLI